MKPKKTNFKPKWPVTLSPEEEEAMDNFQGNGIDPAKITVVGNKEQIMSYWEYRCRTCGQLRLHCFETTPNKCENCKSLDLVVGRPGTLPAREEK